MAISNAVSPTVKSRVTGYLIQKGDFADSTSNLPMRMIFFGEANTANQSNVSTTEPIQVFTENDAAQRWGYGCPIHQMMRIARPRQGGGVETIPTFVLAQTEASGANAQVNTITVTGTATATAVHTIVVNGRGILDGQSYEVSVASGDTNEVIAGKFNDVINSVLASPISSAVALNVVTTTTKWKGASAAELNIVIRTNGNSAGVTYAVADTQAGSGLVSLSDAVSNLGGEWSTILVNPYNSATALDLLEITNGSPNDPTPTGRWNSTIFRPLLAFFGTKESTVANIQAITVPRRNEATNVLCPAPNSAGFSWEAAANVARMAAVQFNSKPHTDITGQSYPDMPVGSDAGDFKDFAARDTLFKSGSSTVVIRNGAYQVQELLTTYHPEGEDPAQFNHVRNLIIDWNIEYGYDILQELYVRDKAIKTDDAIVSVSDVISPKQWRQILFTYFADLESRALIVEAIFSRQSLRVGTGTTNPDRWETFFRYKRSPFVRVASTTGEAGFAFGLG